ncbi:heparinase II/III domain-containing protein [Salisediminibacterium beveridgei]|uniref:Oligohyaluronate lyase n=1 Tax=Salisediminibacterium beveridgei TaxID=632773 RepID=A0A1D7QRS1_9BACI|nr:heparinase II/III family protein [Salisediminibacterium beveridgei]AOM81691.1 Oligohyaluronate lyase [Salisediminibacterium beveridgei]
MLFKEPLQKKFSQIPEKAILMPVPTKKTSVPVADEALKKSWDLARKFDKVDVSKGIPWNLEPAGQGRTLMLYMQSLKIVNHLINAYILTSKAEYLEEAKAIILQWIKYDKKKQHNEMTWVDHATANRFQNLMAFLKYGSHILNHRERKQLDRLVSRHLSFLKDGANHRLHNHGLMMDQAILVYGFAFNSDEDVQFAINRIKVYFFFVFSQKGTHLENSPQYHKLVCNLFENIETYLSSFNQSLGEPIVSMIKRKNEYLLALKTEGGDIPEIGDSAASLLDVKKVKDERFGDFIDWDAGICILKQRQHEIENQLVFISGYSTITHKHYDDLSIILNYDGESILRDPGKYNYSISPERRYVKSAKAHSGLYFDAYPYKLDHANRYLQKVRLTKYDPTADFVLVEGINESYEDASWTKRLVVKFLNHPIYVVFDQVHAVEEQRVVSNFNLDHRIGVVKQADGRVLLTSAKGHPFCLKEWTGACLTEVNEGNLDEPKAVNSLKVNELVPTHQVQFTRDAVIGDHHRIISLETGDVKVTEISRVNSVLRIQLSNGSTYELYT